MPAEWEPHEATWLAWPHERTDWPGKFAPIPWVYGEIVRHLARVERVRILVEDSAAEERAPAAFSKSAGVGPGRRRVFHRCPTESQLDTRLLPHLLSSATAARPRSAATQLALQRLGQVRQLAETTTPRPDRVCTRSCQLRVWEPRYRGRRSCARRRQHRRQRRGHAADHRGVPAQRRAGSAIPALSRDRLRSNLSRLSGRDQGDLAGARHRRRRHARPRRRPGALRRSHNRCHRRRTESQPMRTTSRCRKISRGCVA